MQLVSIKVVSTRQMEPQFYRIQKYYSESDDGIIGLFEILIVLKMTSEMCNVHFFVSTSGKLMKEMD